MAAKFEISKDKAGKSRFRPKDANGETIPDYRLRALARQA